MSLMLLLIAAPLGELGFMSIIRIEAIKGQVGTLMIHYQNLDQLDDLLKKLCGTVIRP